MGNKFKKQIIVSSISLIMSVALLILASFAWLSSNREVATQGMQMQVDTTANLIIAGTTDNIQASNWMEMTLDFNQASAPYAACTHDNNYTLYPNGLKYLTNSNKIGYTTGLITEGVETWASAVNNTSTFYIDKTVYIASKGKEISSATLTAEIVSATFNSSEVSSGPLMATSVDFYIDSVSSGNYKGTTSVKTKATPVTILAAGSTIPLNTSNYITVVMRFYFDGALTDSISGNAFINSASVNTNSVNVSVKFTAVEPS